jgi:hypothetical protein
MFWDETQTTSNPISKACWVCHPLIQLWHQYYSHQLNVNKSLCLSTMPWRYTGKGEVKLHVFIIKLDTRNFARWRKKTWSHHYDVCKHVYKMLSLHPSHVKTVSFALQHKHTMAYIMISTFTRVLHNKYMGDTSWCRRKFCRLFHR